MVHPIARKGQATHGQFTPRASRASRGPALPRGLFWLLGGLAVAAMGLLGVALRLGFSGVPDPRAAVPDASVLALEAPVRGFVSRGLDPAIGHLGVDVALPVGTPVHAAAAGRVLLADSTREGGFVLVLLHAQGLTTVYAHNSRLLVRAGATVTAGQTVALSGNTGRLTSGPHLHFEVWRDRTPLDLSALVSAEPPLP